MTGLIVVDIECSDGHIEWSEPVKVEMPKPDPRQSRITSRGGRSDDWKGRRFGSR